MTALNSTLATEGLREADNRRPLVPSRFWVAGFLTVCFVLVCLSSRDGLRNLYGRWRYEDEYGYGFLIVALLPLLLWRRWPQIVDASGGSRWFGLAILIVAQLCAVIGALGESYYVEQLALIVSLLGSSLGRFRHWHNSRIYAANRFAAVDGSFALHASGDAYSQASTALHKYRSGNYPSFLEFPVFADGNIIDLGTFKLQVVEACSGLRYLLPLTCISFIVAYLYKAPFWKKAVLVLSATPITIAINSVRIAITALLVSGFGTQMAEGFLHEFEGLVIFLIGVLLLVIEIFVLERFRWSKVKIESIMDRQATAKPVIEPFKSALPPVLAVLLCAGAFGATTSIASAFNSTPNPVRE